MIAVYLTHPQIVIDPSIPVPDWSLSELGKARVSAILSKPWLARIGRIVSSEERKATQTAAMIADALSLGVETRAYMGENDRSATGFIPPEKFEAAADAFFGAPETSYRGWERAIDAQARIVAAVDAALRQDGATPVLFVGHGGVGTLLKCHLAGVPIRRLVQPPGGGNIFAFDLADRRLLCDWTPMETFEGDFDGA
ncbi:MAG: histidine phosphatase family protein [Mesorhizobium sp.]